MTQNRARVSVHSRASRKMGHILQDILDSQQARDFDELQRLYQAAEAIGLSDAGDDADLALEMRRRVAEGIFYAALEKNLAPQRCRDFLSALEALGYTDLQIQAQVYIIYARYCLRAGESAEGVRVLEALRSALEAELSRTRVTSRARVKFWRGLMQTCDDVLAKLRAASRSTGRDGAR